MITMRYGTRRCDLSSLFVAHVAIGLLSASAHAVTTNWINNSGGSFTTAANWDNGAPDAADIAVFDRGSDVTYTVTFTQRGGADITNDRLIIGSNTVTFSAAGIFASDYFLDNSATIEADPILGLPVRGVTIGAQANDTAAVLISHLSLLQTVAATLGHVAGSSGTLTLDQNDDLFNVTGGSTANAELIIGRLGTGVLNVSAGADVTVNGEAAGFPAGGISLGRGSSGQGTANITGAGSTLDTNTFLFIGDAGAGTLNITAGGHVENLTGLLGNAAGSTGTANISGSGSTWSNAVLFVGESGHGHLNISGGGVVDSQSANLAGQSSSVSTATVSGAGSLWDNAGGTFHIGLRGNATLSIADGGRVNSNVSTIGDLAVSDGTVNVSGAGSLWANAAELYVGDAGTGTLDISGGGQVTSRLLAYIAVGSDSTGTVTVDGPGSSWTASPSNFYVGVGGDAALEITGGGHVTASGGLSVIGREVSSTSHVTVAGEGSSWTNNHVVVIGYAGDGTLDITDGGHVTNDNGIIGRESSGTGTVVVDGAGSLWTVTRDLYVGMDGQGTLTVQNGGMVDVEGNVNVNTASTATMLFAAIGGDVNNDGQLNLRFDCMDPLPEPIPPMDPAIDISGDLTNDGSIDLRFDCMDPLPPGVPPMDPLRTLGVGRGITNNGTFTVTNADEREVTIQLGAGHSFTNNATGVVDLHGPEDVDGDGTIAAKHIIGGNIVNRGQFNIHSNTQITGSLTVAANADLRIDWIEPCCNMTVDVAGPIANSGTFTMTNAAPLAAGAELASDGELASGAADHRDIILYARDGITNSAAFNLEVVSEAHLHVLVDAGENFVNNASGVVNLVGVGDQNGNGMVESMHTFGGDVINHGQMNVRTNAQIAGSLEVAVDADVLIDSVEPCCGMVLEVAGGVTNSGEVTLKNSMSMAAYTTLQIGAGESFNNEAAGTLQGTGTIGGNVLNRGQVRPGNSTGVLAVTGDFTQEADGTLVVEVGGTTPGSQYDQLAIEGQINLGGLVEVVFAEGFLPQPGNRFDVVTTADGVNGKFVGAALPGLPAGMDWNIDYGTSIVSLVTTIPGDYNSDGNVDAGDYIVWRKTLGEAAVQGIGADGDLSGTIDDADYTVWRANFGATAAGAAAVAFSGATGSASAAVPEPASLILLVVAVVAATLRRRRFGIACLHLLLIAMVCSAVVGPASSATAAPIYRAFVDIDNVSCFVCNDQEFDLRSDAPVEAEATGGFNARRGVARAKAGPGFLKAFGSAQNQAFTGGFVHTRFAASASVNADLFFSSPVPSVVEEIPTRLNFHLDGVFGFDGASDDEQTTAVTVEFTLPGHLTDGSGTNVIAGNIEIIRRDGVTAEIDREGLLADVQVLDETDPTGDFERVIRINANITTPEFVIPMNVPTSLGILISAFGQQSSRAGFGRLSADFERTLRFANDRPVFDLPAGYTANSPALGIVDNQFVVPEPAIGVLLALAVIGALGRPRRIALATTPIRLVVASLLILIGVGPWLTLPARAAPVYTAVAEIGNLGCFRCGDRKVIESNDRPVEAELTGEFSGGQSEARAKAGPGFLEALPPSASSTTSMWCRSQLPQCSSGWS